MSGERNVLSQRQRVYWGTLTRNFNTVLFKPVSWRRGKKIILILWGQPTWSLAPAHTPGLSPEIPWPGNPKVEFSKTLRQGREGNPAFN